MGQRLGLGAGTCLSSLAQQSPSVAPRAPRTWAHHLSQHATATRGMCLHGFGNSIRLRRPKARQSGREYGRTRRLRPARQHHHQAHHRGTTPLRQYNSQQSARYERDFIQSIGEAFSAGTSFIEGSSSGVASRGDEAKDVKAADLGDYTLFVRSHAMSLGHHLLRTACRFIKQNIGITSSADFEYNDEAHCMISTSVNIHLISDEKLGETIDDEDLHRYLNIPNGVKRAEFIDNWKTMVAVGLEVGGYGPSTDDGFFELIAPPQPAKPVPKKVDANSLLSHASQEWL